MKTEEQVRKEILALFNRGKELKPHDKADKQELRQIKARLNFLRPILLYLETHPTKAFCESELEKCYKRLKEANSNYVPLDGGWSKADAAHKKAFETQWDVPTIKTHIKNLEFILNK